MHMKSPTSRAEEPPPNLGAAYEPVASDPCFTDHLLFKTGFAAPRSDLKKQFLLYTCT